MWESTKNGGTTSTSTPTSPVSISFTAYNSIRFQGTHTASAQGDGKACAQGQETPKNCRTRADTCQPADFRSKRQHGGRGEKGRASGGRKKGWFWQQAQQVKAPAIHAIVMTVVYCQRFSFQSILFPSLKSLKQRREFLKIR